MVSLSSAAGNAAAVRKVSVVSLDHPKLTGGSLVNLADALETRQFEEELLVFPLQLLSVVLEISKLVSRGGNPTHLRQIQERCDCNAHDRGEYQPDRWEIKRPRQTHCCLSADWE